MKALLALLALLAVGGGIAGLCVAVANHSHDRHDPLILEEESHHSEPIPEPLTVTMLGTGVGYAVYKAMKKK